MEIFTIRINRETNYPCFWHALILLSNIRRKQASPRTGGISRYSNSHDGRRRVSHDRQDICQFHSPCGGLGIVPCCPGIPGGRWSRLLFSDRRYLYRSACIRALRLIPFGKWTKSHNHTGMQKKYQGKRPEKWMLSKMTDLFPFLPVYFGAGPVQILT